MPDDIMKTLRTALSQLQADRARLDRQISAIHTALGGGTDGRVQQPRRRRRMSPAARRAVSQRMKAYWAQRRAAKAKAGAKGRKSEKSAAK
jgi:hypothetical protein